MNAEDETNGVWKLTFPSEYPTIHTAGHVADKIEITTYMNSENDQGFYSIPGAYAIKL